MANPLHWPWAGWLAMALALPVSGYATETAGYTERTLAVGVIAHDRGPAADHHENGVDLNLEFQFAPLAAGFPLRQMPLRPHLGATLNLTGDTSVAYAGLSARFHDEAQWFGDLMLSVAAHDGPLHKDPVGCSLYSDCGFGVRVMPRFGLEIGYRFNRGAALSLFVDHMSHKWLIGGENEGLDHIGLRYLRPY